MRIQEEKKGAKSPFITFEILLTTLDNESPVH
jgi:hypothetical protein